MKRIKSAVVVLLEWAFLAFWLWVPYKLWDTLSLGWFVVAMLVWTALSMLITIWWFAQKGIEPAQRLLNRLVAPLILLVCGSRDPNTGHRLLD